MPNYAYFSNSSSYNNKGTLIQYNLPYSVITRPSSSQWESIGSVPRGNRDLSIVKISEDEVFIIGGRTVDKYTNQDSYTAYPNNVEYLYKSGNDKCYKYNILTKETTELIEAPQYTTVNDAMLNHSAYSAEQAGNFLNEVVVGFYNNSVYVLYGTVFRQAGYRTDRNYSTNVTTYYRGIRICTNQNLYKLDLTKSELSWELVNNSPSIALAKHGQSFCQIDNKIYMFGGMRCYGNSYDLNSQTSAVEAQPLWFATYIQPCVDEDTYPDYKSKTAHIFYLDTGAIEQIPDVPSDLSGMYTKCCVCNGLIYIISRNAFYSFDPVTYEYRELASPLAADDRRMLYALEQEGKILSIGGSYTSNINQLYDVNTNTWTNANIPMQNVSASAGLIYGENILKFGGLVTTDSSSLCTNSIDSFNLDQTGDTSNNPIVLKIPKGYFYHSNINFDVQDRFTVTTTPQLAESDLEIRLGEYNCSTFNEVFVYLQKAEDGV